MSEHALRSIAEVVTTRAGMRVKQHDRLTAVPQLALMLGWNDPEKVRTETGEYLEYLSQALLPKRTDYKASDISNANH